MLAPRLARAVLSSGREDLIVQYLDGLRRIMIPSARVRGISPDTWAEIVDPLHLELLDPVHGSARVRGRFARKRSGPGDANLAAGGVLIPDDQLFQRRISAYLNSPGHEKKFSVQLPPARAASCLFPRRGSGRAGSGTIQRNSTPGATIRSFIFSGNRST